MAAYAIVTVLIATRSLTGWDLTVRDWLAENSPDWFVWASAVVSRLGQGGPLSVGVLVIAITQSWRKRAAKPIILWLTVMVLLSVIVGIPKTLLRRGAPGDSQPQAVEFFSKAFCGDAACMSYPSGHAANAIAWYGLAAILLAGSAPFITSFLVRASIASAAAIASVTSGHHWVTDTAAGLLAGAFIYALTKRLSVSSIDVARARTLWRPKTHVPPR